MPIDIKNKEALGELFRALSSAQRLHALELFAEETSLPEVASKIGMTRTGFQRTIDAFRNLGLIEEVRKRRYKLSLKGQQILKLIVQFSVDYTKFEREFERDRLKQFILSSSLSLNEIKEILNDLEIEVKDERNRFIP